jgi:hypothetical protein
MLMLVTFSIFKDPEYWKYSNRIAFLPIFGVEGPNS